MKRAKCKYIGKKPKKPWAGCSYLMAIRIPGWTRNKCCRKVVAYGVRKRSGSRPIFACRAHLETLRIDKDAKPKIVTDRTLVNVELTAAALSRL